MFYINFIKKQPLSALFLVAMALALLMPEAAFAMDGGAGGGGSNGNATLGAVICNAVANAKPFGNVFTMIAYAFACVMVVQGIYHFRGHSESPQNFPLHRPIMMWLGAMALFALPEFVSTVVSTIFTSPGTGSSTACVAGSASNSTSAGLDGMMTNFVTNIKGPMIILISAIAILCGLFMVVKGLMKASKYGFDPKANSIHSILTHILFGALLMSIGDNLTMMTGSLFANATPVTADSSSVLSWGFVSNVGGGSQQFANAIAAALGFVQIIGAIAFVRGWLIMKKVVEGGSNATLAQGLTHVLGGVLAINIAVFVQTMDGTFGTGLF